MDLELVKFIDSDLTWKDVKKGQRSMLRRRKRTNASGSQSGSVVFDYEKVLFTCIYVYGLCF